MIAPRLPDLRRLLATTALFLLCCLNGPAVAATYGYAEIPLAWVNNATHTDVTWGGSAQCGAWNSSPVDDDGTAEINLGFSFTFGATSYTSVRINSNGRLQFNNNHCGYGTQTVGPPPTYPYPYPNASLDRSMRIYGADFCPAGGGTGCAGRVTYAQLGSAPYRSFVVTWSQMKEWNSGSSLFNVQIILQEGGDFIYQFKNIANMSQGLGQTGYQLTTGDYVTVDMASVSSLVYTALRFFKPTPPIVEYRFDQCGGSSGAVTTANSVLDTSAVTPLAPGSPSGTITADSSYGKVCTGFKFNGAGGTYISVPHATKLNQPYVSVSAWVRHSAAAMKSWEAILAKGDTTYRLHLNGGCSINGITTPLAFTFGFNGGCANADLNSGVVPVAGQWYHVVGTYDGATIKIFVDGVLKNSQALATTIGTNTYPLYLGENSQQTGRNWAGDIDEIQVFDRALPDAEVLSMYNNGVIGLERTGTLRACAICNPTLGNFNAFDSSTAAGSVSGYIRTKIAGTSLALSSGNIDAVSLSGGALSNYNGNTTVQFLDARDNSGALDAKGCRSTWTEITTDTGLASFTLNFPNTNRVSFPARTPVNSWPEVRLKITRNATNYGCSNDAFAIRPSYIDTVSAAAKDDDWQTSGTGRSLANAGATGGNVHAAGIGFSLSGLTAKSASGATTGNYAGTPTLIAGNLLLPTEAECPSCAPGSFAVGSWTASSGTLSSNSASYSNAGSFQWEVEDRSFANVDSVDSTRSQRYFRSNAVVSTGRFVPASFQLNLNVPQFQTFGSSCGSRSFTYLGQPFGYLTPPSVSVKAMNGAGTPAQTANYVGSLWKLAAAMPYSSATCTTGSQTCSVVRQQAGASTLSSTYALATATPGWDGSNLSTQTGSAAIVSAGDGSGTLSFGATDKLALYRNTASLQAPYTAAVTLALQLNDISEAGVSGNPAAITGSLAATPLAFDSGAEFRAGRLRLSSTYGSELLPVRVPLRAESYTGAAWTTNTADNCTALPTNAFFTSGGLAPVVLSASPVTLAAGQGTLVFNATGATGSFDLAANLNASGSDTSCNASHGGTAANLPWLQGYWAAPASCNTTAAWAQDPNARIRLGTPKAPYIYLRERY